MSTYEDEREMADVALDHADLDFPRTMLWTRDQRLAQAQVHATLAVAAAVVASCPAPVVIGEPDDDIESGGCDDPNCAICDGPKQAFTGSERADEARR